MARGPWARGPPAPPIRPWLVAAVIVAAAVAAAADDVAVAVDVAVVAVANSPRNLTQVLPTPPAPRISMFSGAHRAACGPGGNSETSGFGINIEIGGGCTGAPTRRGKNLL